MNNRLSGKHNFASLLKFSMPTIIMMVFMSLYSMVDGVFVSRLIGTDALSAVNIVYPIVSIVIASGIMLATGASAVVARKMGEGNPLEAKQDFTLVVIVGVILGILFTIVGLTFLEPILRFLGANDSLFILCEEYAYYMVWFTVPAMLQMLFQTFFVTSGRPTIGLVVTVLGGIANIILDYVFIAVFDLGIAGAAIATGIGYSIPAVFGLFWFSLKHKETLYFTKPIWRAMVLVRTFTNGSSEMVTNLSTAVITYLFNVTMVKWLGTDGVAAITIVLYAEYLLIAIYLGYSTGIAPIVSYNHGEKNITQLRKLFKISMQFLITCSVATFLGAFLFAKPIVSVFASSKTEVFTLAVHGFYLYSLCYLFKGINIFASSLFTALSDGKTSAILSFMRTLVFIVLGMILLPYVLEVDGIWLAVPFAELLSIALSIYCFKKLLSKKWVIQTDIKDIEIVPITAKNISEVLSLNTANGQEDFIETTSQYLSEAKEDSRLRPVAIYNRGKIIGFAMYGHFEQEHRVWLDRFLIDGRYQNQGFGTKALHTIIRHLSKEYKCDQIYLSVYKDNKPALHMSKKYGFAPNGERDINGEDVMVLNL